jgi:hypothetical protein
LTVTEKFQSLAKGGKESALTFEAQLKAEAGSHIRHQVLGYTASQILVNDKSDSGKR